MGQERPIYYTDWRGMSPRPNAALPTTSCLVHHLLSSLALSSLSSVSSRFGLSSSNSSVTNSAFVPSVNVVINPVPSSFSTVSMSISGCVMSTLYSDVHTPTVPDGSS
jgi:hypothetical protein